MAIDCGKRQACENCRFGSMFTDDRGRYIKAYCRTLKCEIPEKRYKQLVSCLYYEGKE